MSNRKKFGIAVLIAIILHFIVLSMRVQQQEGKGNADKKPQSSKVTEFIPKQQKVNIKQKVETGEGRKKLTKKLDNNCEDGLYYIGVGFTNNWLDAVTKIAQGYSADRAGLKIGDVLRGFYDAKMGNGLLPIFKLTRGEEGDPVTLLLYRDGVGELKLSMVREKICTKGKKDE